MSKNQDRVLLRKLLDLSDELGELRRRQREAPPEGADRALLSRRARAILGEVTGLLGEVGAEGHLHLLLKRYKLNRQHVMVLLELLKQRLREDDPWVQGRALLTILFEGSFALLDGVRLLESRSPLATSGVMTANLSEAPEGAEVLDLRYRISDRAFRLLTRALGGGRGKRRDLLDRPVKPYRSNLQYLMDLRRLALLYQKRAAKVFRYEEWDELGMGLPDSLTFLNRLIPRFSRHVTACLAATEKADRFHFEKVRAEHELSHDECIILVTLVFRELLQGNPFLDAADLVKLICRSEEDLVRKRKVLHEKSALVRNQLVVLEEMILGKELSAEVYVPNAVVDAVLGPVRGSTGTLQIDAESRKDFQRFLREMDDSDEFFEQL